MIIDSATILALFISVGCNILAFYYIRDLLGRLGWLTQNMANLTELLQGFQTHIKGVYELEKFYGDNDIKVLVQHTSDLIEVIEDYLEVGLDSELIEEELIEDKTDDTKKEKEEDKNNVLYQST